MYVSYVQVSVCTCKWPLRVSDDSNLIFISDHVSSVGFCVCKVPEMIIFGLCVFCISELFYLSCESLFTYPVTNHHLLPRPIFTHTLHISNRHLSL